MNSHHKENMERCAWFFQAAYLAEAQPNLMHLIKWPANQKAYSNGGGIIARVWAFRKFEKAFNEILKMSDEWWPDQSIHKPLLLWSVYKEQNIGTRPLLPRGMIGLDYEEHFFSIPVSGPIGEAVFLHLAGNAFSWRERAKEIITNLTWYDMFVSKKFRSHNLWKLQTYVVSGKRLHFDYESICGKFF
ncbi:hypothetical protein, unlikely [Trypanosoma brucei gambiense DAL972]|uniref:Uncharacterized protein n=1 Tax=Trypanosoma brucei gambiense (strain MHOM/CI/86/DAL972) TaxID=679716 RepID=C9ZQ13_TRYB9|nr:hypothetical protein, unlikely [Trypanosoma brucei gambiense DAL972]CBH11491.1 hypothetical protein, unlikely [Trypanosoma brucei gambiense DAL972]|eukprot:XP_011773778.1 hypothetical protein, unlikely [Trypanosoma brucei gambiense DAL972]